MGRNKKNLEFSKARRDHQKIVKKRRRLAKQRATYRQLKQWAIKTDRVDFTLNSFPHFLALTRKSRPSFSSTIRYLARLPQLFSNVENVDTSKGHFIVPTVFSLTDNFSESFAFLKRLFLVLYAHKPINVQIDYQNCQRIDLDASVVLDVLLKDFIQNIHTCRATGHSTTLEVRPINYERPEIKEILFSIGSYKTIKGWSMNFPGILTFPLRIGTLSRPDRREIDNTDLVTYIGECLGKCNRALTGEAEKELSDIIGEVLANAEEHSTTKKRYLIGYFKMNQDQSDALGTFSLVVFNFGDTIYEKLKDPSCPNKAIVEDMRSLSKSYTDRGFFGRILKGPAFEEETLWTLYALQEGVTRYQDWNRGNGTMEFIESFFALKGDNLQDNNSKLTLFSGNTRIVFDGTYSPKRIIRTGKDGKKEVKVMTFNHSEDINEQPDRKFVNFADEFFPGTLITARICIKSSNTEVRPNNHELNIN